MRTLSYKPLLIQLIKREKTKLRLSEECGFSRTTLAKFSKGEPVGLDIILRICNTLDCDLSDVVETVPRE